ncbi:hypothetical protein [Simiduia litorea]|uniref:hypothetical protein n=1 Tax=Simiduia litorea TaxID=1435348 RepID=UPI0036F3D06F
MKVVVAIRASNPSQARQLLADQACEIHKSRFESQEPALRNLIDGLYRRGLDVELKGASLAWFLIEGALSPTQWLERSAVAICFSFDWFQQQAAQIRYLKGIAYCDAAADWAQLLPINGGAAHVVQSEGKLDWQGVVIERGLEPKSDVPKPSSLRDTRLLVEPSEARGLLSDSTLIVDASSLDDHSVSVEQIAIDTLVQPKKNSARKVVSKILTATKNMAKRKPKAAANSAGQEAKTLVVGVESEAESVATKVAASLGEAEKTVAKKRGRPRKILAQHGDQDIGAIEIEQGMASAHIEQKVIVEPVSSTASEGVESETILTPKKRGRPRKVIAPVVSDVDEEQLDLFV